MRQSVTLESYLEEVKLSLPEINLTKPKSNLPPGEHEALKALKGDKQINLRKADKGTKFYGSFPFGLGVHGKLLTQSVALCCFSITPSFSISSRQIFKSAWTLSKHTEGKNPRLSLQKVPKCIFFYCEVCKVVTFLLLIDLKKSCHTEMNSQFLTFVNKILL